MAQGMRIRGVELDDAGAAIDDTDNVKLYAVDQTSTAVATASTDASGFWAFDHASQGRFDVKITNGSDIVWIRARDEFQVTTIQARNPTTANAAGHFMSTVPIATDTASLVATFGFRPSQESSGVETPDTPIDGISGRIDYELSNDNVPVDQWIAGRFEWEGVCIADGSEDGQLNWWTMVAGTLTEELHLDATALWPEAAGGLALGKATLGYADLFLEDAADIQFGAGQDVLMRWSTGDASNHSFVIGLGDSNQAFHITDKNAVATDWNIAATTHPNLYIHSNTGPATNFLRLGDHDGTTAYIDVMGGTTLAFQIAGTSELTLTATVLSPVSDATTDLGATTVGFNDLHLGSGGVVNFDGGDVTLTHATNTLTFAGGTTIFSGAVDIQGGYANSGGAPYDGVVDAGDGGNWDTLQAGDDDLDAGDYTMLVKGGTYGAGLTVSTNDAYIYVEPGTQITGNIVLSGANVKIAFGPGCNIAGTVTLSGANCSVIFENGCDLDGIIVSGNLCFVDGGGWDTISNGGTARIGISVTGTDAIVQNISAQTTAGGGSAFVAIDVTGGRFTFKNVRVIDSDAAAFHWVAPDGLITGCTILGADTQGMFCDASTDSSSCRIIGNRITATANQGILIQNAGDNTVVSGNEVEAVVGVSVEIGTNAENCVVVGNRLDGAVTDGSGTSTVANNDTTAY